jgi:predicted deacylase
MQLCFGSIPTLIVAFVAGLATSASHAETVYTGDKIQGVHVISRLDVNDLAPGKKYQFLFEGVSMATGQRWYVPVMVAKGSKSGKRVLLVAGVHGDELSPVDVVQRSFAALNPATLSGTVLAVLDLSRPAKEMVQRKWPTPNHGGSLVDMNHVWPGNGSGNAPQRQAWLIWNRLFRGNVEVALDFHTAATGGDFTLFIFADFRNAEIETVAKLFPVQQIKNDPGVTGTLETAFVEAGIPAVTVEVGGPRIFDAPKIMASVEGVANVLAYYRVTDPKIGRTSKESNAFFGNKLEEINTSTGGFVELLVKLGQKVKSGQRLAIQRNSFGEVVAEYTTSDDGEVAVLGTDALREPGSLLMEILSTSSAPECAKGGCPYLGEHH